MTGELHDLLKKPVAQRQTLNKQERRYSHWKEFWLHATEPTQQMADDEAKMTAAGSTVLDHHFDVHDNCGPWCPRKRMTQQQ
jgi:hypothetical protein